MTSPRTEPAARHADGFGARRPVTVRRDGGMTPANLRRDMSGIRSRRTRPAQLIDKVYSLTNKGVHSGVAQAEVDYPLAGEILRIFEDSSKSDPSE